MSETLDLDMERVIPLESERVDVESVRRITSLSADNIKANFSKYVIQLSPRREGMKVRHALLIAAGKA
jgi:hypothetical protein